MPRAEREIVYIEITRKRCHLGLSWKGIDMRKFSMALLSAGLCLVSAGNASAAVTVTYVKPENFSDLPWSAGDRAQVLHELQEYITRLGAKLPPDRDLKLEILDIDLAG